MSRKPRRLCALDTLADGRAALIWDGKVPAQHGILLVRRGDAVTGFRNACPHVGLPLDWKADRLAVRNGDYLRCSHHGALFRVSDGMCVAGPCRGEGLTPLPVEIIDGMVQLAEEICSP